MDDVGIMRYICDTFAGVETSTAFGYTFFFYGADRMMPFATLSSEDNEHDTVSNLNRPSVFRLNMGVGKDTYQRMFGPPPAKAGESGVVATGHDFSALDQIMPHPVYAPQYWVCVLNPGDTTLDQVRTMLAEAHARAVEREVRKSSSNEG